MLDTFNFTVLLLYTCDDNEKCFLEEKKKALNKMISSFRVP